MNRKKAEQVALDYIKSVDMTGENVEMYKKYFKSLTNAEFDTMMHRMRDGEFYLTAVIPNGKKMVTLPFLYAGAKKHGIRIFDTITFKEDNGEEFTPPHTFKLLMLPVRRTTQHQEKGLSVAKHTRNRNRLTGQVSGTESDSGSLTVPEAQILQGIGAKNTLKELMGDRGGDVRAVAALNAFAFKTGKVERKQLLPFANGAGSNKTLKAFYRGIHMDLNI